MVAANRESEAFPKAARIRKRREFLEAYRTGKKSFGRYVVVFALPNDGLGPRIGVTATRKVGPSNLRNRRKRWTREVFRRNREAIGLSSLDIDLVVNLKRVADIDFQSFENDLIRTLGKAARSAARQGKTRR